MVWSRLPEREAEIVGKDKDGVAQTRGRYFILRFHLRRNYVSAEAARLVRQPPDL
jgi:hypothetical protein